MSGQDKKWVNRLHVAKDNIKNWREFYEFARILHEYVVEDPRCTRKTNDITFGDLVSIADMHAKRQERGRIGPADGVTWIELAEIFEELALDNI